MIVHHIDSSLTLINLHSIHFHIWYILHNNVFKIYCINIISKLDLFLINIYYIWEHTFAFEYSVPRCQLVFNFISIKCNIKPISIIDHLKLLHIFCKISLRWIKYYQTFPLIIPKLYNECICFPAFFGREILAMQYLPSIVQQYVLHSLINLSQITTNMYNVEVIRSVFLYMVSMKQQLNKVISSIISCKTLWLSSVLVERRGITVLTDNSSA